MDIVVNWTCAHNVLGVNVDPCQGAASIVNGFFHFLHNLLLIVINIPPQFTYLLNGIQAMWGLFYAISILVLVLLVMIGGFQMMIGRATGIEYTPPSEFIPRIFAAAMASFASRLICQTIIVLGNAIANAELHFTVAFVNRAGGDAILAFISLLAPLALAFASNPVVAFLFIVLLVLLVLLIIKASARIILIDLLIATSPLAIILWVLPQTRKWAAFWLSLFITSIVEVVLEDLCFCLALVILFSGDVQGGDAPLRIIIAISAIFLMTRIPSILARLGGAGGHRGFLSSPLILFAALSGYGASGLPFAGGVNGFLNNFGLNRLGTPSFGGFRTTGQNAANANRAGGPAAQGNAVGGGTRQNASPAQNHPGPGSTLQSGPPTQFASLSSGPPPPTRSGAGNKPGGDSTRTQSGGNQADQSKGDDPRDFDDVF